MTGIAMIIEIFKIGPLLNWRVQIVFLQKKKCNMLYLVYGIRIKGIFWNKMHCLFNIKLL